MPHRVNATATSVVIVRSDGSAGRVELFVDGEATLRVRGEEAGLRLNCTFPSGLALGAKALAGVTDRAQVDVNIRASLRRYHSAILRGASANRTASRDEVNVPAIEAGGEGARWELAIDEFASAWEERVDDLVRHYNFTKPPVQGAPLEAPDLNALLAVQVRWLARKETWLGRKIAAAGWRAARTQRERVLFAQLLRGGQLAGRALPENEEVRARSLVGCMPVLLGRRLPRDVARALVRRIRSFVTPVGVVWEASTYLTVLGLESLGEHRLARTLARWFFATCARSGFAENFNAITGAPLRDPGYTCAAGTFFLLAARVRPVRRPK